MAVMTKSPKKSEIKSQQVGTKKYPKPLSKSRPITATLEHPLILDIKLLKKLDMTTFTKKGLIALSKFCGISLIKKTDSNRKFNKCIKSIQRSKKQLTKEGNELFAKAHSMNPNKRENVRTKKKPARQIPKLKPEVDLKVIDETNWLDEDFSDGVCKRHDGAMKTSKLAPDHKWKKEQVKNSTQRKPLIDDLLNDTIVNIIPEPCKTCSRSEHPERFHSHPKATVIMSESLKSGKTNPKSDDNTNLEHRFKNSLTTKDYDECDDADKNSRRKSLSANDTNDSIAVSPKKSSSSCDDRREYSPSGRFLQTRTDSESSTKSSLSPDPANSTKSRNIKKSFMSSSSVTKSNNDVVCLRRMKVKNITNISTPKLEVPLFIKIN